MTKLRAFTLMLILSPLIAGVYGALHNQISYSVSPEYFTEFKFIQFGFANPGEGHLLPAQRVYAAGVGFGAVWWLGLILGSILSAIGLGQADGKQMFRVTFVSLSIVLLCTVASGMIGLFGYEWVLGKSDYYIDSSPGRAWSSETALAYFRAGNMHNFGYLGAVAGFLIAILYHAIVLILRARKMQSSST